MQLEKLPSGRWRAVVRYAGRRERTPSFPTKREARDAGVDLAKQLADEAPGSKRLAVSATVGELLDRYLAQTHYSPTTLAEVTRAVDRVPAHFKARRCADVTTADVDALYVELGATLAPSAVHRVHEVLRPAFRLAAKWRWARANPAAEATPPRRTTHEVHPPDLDVMVAVLAAVRNDPVMAAYVRLAASTGARRGELMALRWGDVDRSAWTLSITRAVVWTPASGIVVKDTKTGARGRRLISLDRHTVAALRRWRWVLIHQHPRAADPDCYVFGLLDVPRRPDWATQRWVRLCDRLGVEGVRLHDLRHYHATRLLASGHDVVTVSTRLGHASAATTLRIYAHRVSERDRAAADAIGDELGR